MPSPNGHRAERDGCGCPPWTRHCGHFPDGRVLWLNDLGLFPFDEMPGHTGGGPFFVLHGMLGRCSCPVGHLVIPDGHDNMVEVSDLPAAEAEFRKREATLLGRVHV